VKRRSRKRRDEVRGGKNNETHDAKNMSTTFVRAGEVHGVTNK
jgi:hypothetical protein